MEKTYQIKYTGEISLGDCLIPCYVLENGERVLSTRGMQNALLLSEDSSYEESGISLVRVLASKNLKPYLHKGLTRGTDYKPMSCYLGNQRINAFKATTLADICEAFLDAREAITLFPRQNRIADQCNILMRGFARVGINALVDEATGYQYDREKLELQKILTSYVSEEVAKWQLTFDLDFYKQIFRLWDIPFIPKYIKRKPSFIGKLTTKYIYDLLPEKAMEVVRDKAERDEKGRYKYRWHQLLTDDVGREQLKRQISMVTVLMQVASDRAEFDKLFKKAYHEDPLKIEDEFREIVEKGAED